MAATLRPVQIQNAFVHKFGPIGEVYTSRLAYIITKKGNRHRRVVLISSERLFVVDLEGVVRRVVELGEVEGGFSHGREVLLQMKRYKVDPSVFVEELEVPENSGMPKVLETISALKGGSFEVTKSTGHLNGIAQFKKSEGYNSPMVGIAKVHPRPGLPPSPVDKELQAELQRRIDDNKRLSIENQELRRQATMSGGSPKGSPKSPGIGREELRKLQDDALRLRQVPRYVFIPTEEHIPLPPSPRISDAMVDYTAALNLVTDSQQHRLTSTYANVTGHLRATRQQLASIRSQLAVYEQQNREIAKVLKAAIPGTVPTPAMDSLLYPETPSPPPRKPAAIRQPPPREEIVHEVDLRNTKMLQAMLDLDK